MKERVFVYGTLRSGGGQSARMNCGQRLGQALVRGDLYQVDWYPAAVLGGVSEIVGEVFELNPEDLAALDEYEGDEYRRVRATVRGIVVGEAWIWEWARSVEGLRRIPSGDWLNR